MGSASRQNVDVAIPRMQDRDRQMRGRSEAEKSDTITRFHSGDTQTAKPDNAST